METLNRNTAYTIAQYKKGIHRMYDTIKVYSNSGKVFHIGKSVSVNRIGKKNFSEVYYLGKKANFDLTGTDYRRSKTSVINFLKAN